MNRSRDGVAIAVVLALGLTLASALPAAAARHAAQSGPVDINTASQQLLESLPGVGAATAKKIIAGRPYASVADLAKAGVRAKTIEKITPLVTIGGATTAAAGSSPTTHSSFPWGHAAGTTAATAGAATAGTTTAAAGTTAQVPPAAGMVWVNLSTKVYHYAGDRWYGKTKNGKFMTEQEAIAAGYRAAKSKSTAQQTQTP